MIERARAKWEDEPKYPNHARPAPPGAESAPAWARVGAGLGLTREGRTNSSPRRLDCSRGRA